MNKIYLFAFPAGWNSYGVVQDAEETGDTCGYALAEDGDYLCSHLSSGLSWSKHDMGLTSNWKHDIYENKYPNGYELEWIDYDDLDNHEGFQKAYQLNQIIKES